MRRKIGPAYERSPAEQTGKWISDNLGRLLTAVVTAAVFCFVVNWLVDGLFNFLATSGHDDVRKPFSSASPTVSLVKLVGSAVLIFFMVRSRMR